MYSWKILVPLCKSRYPQPPVNGFVSLFQFAFGLFHVPDNERHGNGHPTNHNHAKLFAVIFGARALWRDAISVSSALNKYACGL